MKTFSRKSCNSVKASLDKVVGYKKKKNKPGFSQENTCVRLPKGYPFDI